MAIIKLENMVSGSFDVTYGSAPSTQTITLGFKPKKIWYYEEIHTSSTATANGLKHEVYDEDLELPYWSTIGDSWANSATGSIINSITDTGFTIKYGSSNYGNSASIRYWAVG